MIEEIWKDIEGYNGVYQVSNMGRIRSFKGRNTRILKGSSHLDGYRVVRLVLGGKGKTLTQHKLVAKAFCEGYEKGLSVDHINGIKTDNRAVNLRWVTLRKNHEGFRLNKSIYGCGVRKLNNGRFISTIRVKGSLKYIGTYDTPEQAQQARTDFKVKHNIK